MKYFIILLLIFAGCASYTQSPAYFLQHTGEVRIVDKIDHPDSTPLRPVVGYVEMNPWEDYPCYVQKSAFGSTLKERILHEQTHSFEFNISAKLTGEYERFHADFDPLLGREYDDDDLPPIVLKLLKNPKLRNKSPKYRYVWKFITGGYAEKGNKQ